jgi:tetratricopeptide (TPR) repeat protein
MRLIIFIQLCLLLILSQSIFAQDSREPETVDCNVVIGMDIGIDLEPFKYIYACDGGYDCYPEDFLLCHFQLAIEALKLCEIEDLFCRNETLLSVVAFYTQDADTFGVYIVYPPTIELFSQVKSAVSAKDFDTALALLQEATIDIEYPFPLLIYSRGLVHEMLNQSDEALQAYTEALELLPSHPLFHYARAQLYGQIGNTIEASFETAWLEDFLIAFAPDLLPIITPLSTAYPLDTARFSTWMKYPVMRNWLSPMGDQYTDMTQIAPTPVQIGIYDELDMLLAIDVSALRYSAFTGDVLNTYRFTQTSDNYYEHISPVNWGRLAPMTLEFRGGLIFGEEYSPGAESGVTAKFILAPLNHFDPRDFFGEPACEGGVISRLRRGMSIIQMDYPGSNSLRYATVSGGTLDQFFDSGFKGDEQAPGDILFEMYVTENFTCIGDELWWEVSDGHGTIGWRPENDGTTYVTNPLRDLREFFYCPLALRTRLFIGATGRVLNGLGANNLRAEPDTHSEILMMIPEAGQFIVVDGPVCTNDIAWWQVEYGEIVGWTAESDNMTYWVEPTFE